MKMGIIKAIGTFVLVIVVMSACSSEESREGSQKKVVKKNEVETTTEPVSNKDFMVNKGVGPIKSITLGDIDEALVKKGKEVFKANCTACHKFEKRFVGPPLAGITQRRSPEWIMNMILNPENMVKDDSEAKALLAEYLAPMANQNLTKEEARALLELFRTKN